MEGLQATGIDGFSNRATHNLWTLLEEVQQIEAHLANGSYQTWYRHHLDNSIYLSLIQQILNQIIGSTQHLGMLNLQPDVCWLYRLVFQRSNNYHGSDVALR